MHRDLLNSLFPPHPAGLEVSLDTSKPAFCVGIHSAYML